MLFWTMDAELSNRLKKRKDANALRILKHSQLIDFCSNDYLGFAKKNWNIKNGGGGSGGSRLISGHSAIFDEVEAQIANFHNTEAALIFNSGYDANLGFFSAVPTKGDTVIYDEYCHASIRDGLGLSTARSYSFTHNSITDLKKKIANASGNIFVVVESIYSMDGDNAPLKETADICKINNANLVIDEAHATGIFGKKGEGLAKNMEVFARIHTFGKALGCHGAAICGSTILRKYLINFARSFIYTTALPKHSIATISAAYSALHNTEERDSLKNNIALFKRNLNIKNLIESNSPIQSIIIGGNDKTKKIAESLQESGFDVRAILHPTVPKGSERIRICIHSYNTKEEIKSLCKKLTEIL